LLYKRQRQHTSHAKSAGRIRAHTTNVKHPDSDEESNTDCSRCSNASAADTADVVATAAAPAAAV